MDDLEKSREQIISENLQQGYTFTFTCSKCKTVIPLSLERTSYSGFGTNDYCRIIFSCPGCRPGQDVCEKCAPERSSNNSMHCVVHGIS